MRTFVIFVTRQDLDSDMSVQDPLYYKTLNGMLRNYYGNSNSTASYIRSYGYVVLQPQNVQNEDVVSYLDEVASRLPEGHSSYDIPVVIDCQPEEMAVILNKLTDVETNLRTRHPAYKLNLLVPSKDGLKPL